MDAETVTHTYQVEMVPEDWLFVDDIVNLDAALALLWPHGEYEPQPYGESYTFVGFGAGALAICVRNDVLKEARARR